MARVSRAEQEAIAKAVTELEETLKPEVRYIRYDIGKDWDGDPGIFFRIVLSDEAAREPGLFEVARRVERAVERRINSLEEYGLFPFFNFRSESEQLEMKDPIWA